MAKIYVVGMLEINRKKETEKSSRERSTATVATLFEKDAMEQPP